ncbi:MAG: hypothetical protein AAFQ89_06495 [Cyanobacteria bacterium J06626_18]
MSEVSEDVLAGPSSALVPTDAKRPNSVEERLDEMGKTLLDFKLTADKRVETLEQKLRQSQRQIGFLRAGWLLTVLGVGGGFLVFGFMLRLEQVQLREQVSAIAVYTGPDSEDVQRLDALEAQVPEELPERLEQVEETLMQIDEDVAVLRQDQDQRREVISVLSEALQAIVSDAPTDESDPEEAAEEEADEANSEATDDEANAEDTDE